jgi:hypothetical protein
MIIAKKTLYHILKGANHNETAVLLVAVLVMFYINLFALASLVAFHFSVIEQFCATTDIVLMMLYGRPKCLAIGRLTIHSYGELQFRVFFHS